MKIEKKLKIEQSPLNETQTKIQNRILEVINGQKLSDVYVVLNDLSRNLKHNSIINVSH